MPTYRSFIKIHYIVLMLILCLASVVGAWIVLGIAFALWITLFSSIFFLLVYFSLCPLIKSYEQTSASLDALGEQKLQFENQINEKQQALNENNLMVSQIQHRLQDIEQQLISQEQMAAVGLLAAGIAHEIKNPLNFINNFSEMTVELTNELKQEIASFQTDSDKAAAETIQGILDDIASNCKKIHEHGQRAESIVKNMLMQSRTTEVQKVPVDVNSLLEEFVNLSYHGMRALNNRLNVKIEKNLDKSIVPIVVNPQSIGRVFLNIINNGVYSANEKAEKISSTFMPTITIETQQDSEYINIKIRDNGEGIPEDMRSKIFEPFFTTKPAGEGTGLGLALCYDIVVKEHGGKLDIISNPGEFTEFIIKLPKVQTL